MKHAIEELNALLETWGPQKSEEWNKDLQNAVGYLEDISQEPFDPNSFTPPAQEDDDLGELDPSAACKLDNPDCESCQ